MNLVQASRNGNLAAVQCLLAAGADDDEALRWASQYGHTAVVQCLLAAGANVHTNANNVSAEAVRDQGQTDLGAMLRAYTGGKGVSEE